MATDKILGTERPLVLIDGNVQSVDRLMRTYEAVAFENGKIAALGSSRDLLSRYQESDADIVNVGGKIVLPGFIETHSHPMGMAARRRDCVDVSSPPVTSIADIQERVREAVNDRGPEVWIRGERYDDTAIVEMRHPTRGDLDAVSPNNPVMLVHVSGHFAVANTKALQIAAVDLHREDPPRGWLGRYEDGTINGLLAEMGAIKLVNQVVPVPNEADLVENLSLVEEEYLSSGVTLAHDLAIGHVGGGQALQAYEAAYAKGSWRLPVYGFVSEHVSESFDDVCQMVRSWNGRSHDPRLRVGGIKMWADGSIQGLTGALREPYCCDNSVTGSLLFDDEALQSRLVMIRDNGMRAAVHANGDLAIEQLIRQYGRALGTSTNEFRWRIEHCQMADTLQLEQIARQELLVSFFIKHVYYWGDRHRDRFLGIQRANRIDPVREARRMGVRSALHSDCPVTPLSPVEGIAVAVHRRTSSGAVLGEDERLSVEAAVAGYTSEASWFSYDESTKGTLEVGKDGDAVILNATALETLASPTGSVQPRDRVLSTIIAGRVIWEREDAG
ncbi:MAG: amidohydrolase [Actinobacteria bacterium]|nr:amidohydrolase [Actinomycetota bacterium]